jgi:Zinc dependent phospholipase C
MPAEFVHLALARRIADALALDGALRPAFALGNVAPDVNNVRGGARQDTHFWYWPEGGDVSGALTLLARYPKLRARCLAPSERAFVAGYLSHLITDEQEIVGLFRPYVTHLSKHVPAPDARELRLASLIVVDATVEACDPSRLQTAIAELRAAARLQLRDGLLPFVAMADVREWAARTLAVAGLPASRPRVEPHLAANEPPAAATHRGVALQEAIRRALPPAAIHDFIERSTRESADFIRAYLAGRPLPTPQGTQPLPEAVLHWDAP